MDTAGWKKVLVVALCVIGVLAIGSSVYRVYRDVQDFYAIRATHWTQEDRENFKKIVVWIAQKQAQEAEYAKRQAAQRAAAPVAPAPSAGGQ